jgi:hypothetical protein
VERLKAWRGGRFERFEKFEKSEKFEVRVKGKVFFRVDENLISFQTYWLSSFAALFDPNLITLLRRMMYGRRV